MTLTVRVISPDRVILNQEVEEVILPTTTGQLGILTDHAPLMTALDTGVMRYRLEKSWSAVALMGGFAEIEENEVNILVNNAEAGTEIDAEQARKEFAEAEARLSKVLVGDKQEKIQAERGLQRARARVQASTPI